MSNTILSGFIFLWLFALFTGCTNSIRLEGTDLSNLENDSSPKLVKAALGDVVSEISTSKFTASYYIVNEPYTHVYKQNDFSSYDDYYAFCSANNNPLVFICIPIALAQGAVAGIEQSVETSKAKKAQPRSGVVIFWNKTGSVENAIRTALFDDPEASIAKVSDLYARALTGDVEALTAIGASSLNPARSHNLFCQASSRGGRIAMEAIAGGVLSGRYPSTNRKEEASAWFALAHARSIQELFAKRPLGAKDFSEHLSILRQDYEDLKLPSGSNLVDQNLLSLQQKVIRIRIEWDLKTAPDELVEQLVDHIEHFKPNPDTCQPIKPYFAKPVIDEAAQVQAKTAAPEKKISSSKKDSELALVQNDCDVGCDGKWVASIHVEDPVTVTAEVPIEVKDRKFSEYALSGGKVRIQLNGAIDRKGTLRGYCGINALRGWGTHGGFNFSSEFRDGGFTASGLFKSIDGAPNYRITFRRSGA